MDGEREKKMTRLEADVGLIWFNVCSSNGEKRDGTATEKVTTR